MKQIYEKVLKLARMRVFEDNKYEKIISFCKYKLDNNVYTRNETIKHWETGKEIETRVFITTEKADNFSDYEKKQEKSKNTIYHNVYIRK